MSMKKKRFTEEQIIAILQKNAAGIDTATLCREQGITPGTLYNWRHKYGTMEVSEAKKLRHLEQENGKLKRIVADLTLENIAIKDVLSKNF